jgi:hypothetical protein
MKLITVFFILFITFLNAKPYSIFSLELSTFASYQEAKSYYIALPSGIEKKAFLYPKEKRWSVRVARTKKAITLKSLQKKLINIGYKGTKIVSTIPIYIVGKKEILTQNFSLIALSHGEYDNIIHAKKLQKGVYQLRVKIDTTLFKKQMDDLALYIVLPEGTKLFKHAATFNGEDVGVKKVDNLYIFEPESFKYGEVADFSIIFHAKKSISIVDMSYIVYGHDEQSDIHYIEPKESASIRVQTQSIYQNSEIYVMKSNLKCKKRFAHFSIYTLMRNSERDYIEQEKSLIPDLYQLQLKMNYAFKTRNLSDLQLYVKIPQNVSVFDQSIYLNNKLITSEKKEGYYAFDLSEFDANKAINFVLLFSPEHKIKATDFEYVVVAKDIIGEYQIYAPSKYTSFKNDILDQLNNPSGLLSDW